MTCGSRTPRWFRPTGAPSGSACRASSPRTGSKIVSRASSRRRCRPSRVPRWTLISSSPRPATDQRTRCSMTTITAPRTDTTTELRWQRSRPSRRQSSMRAFGSHHSSSVITRSSHTPRRKQSPKRPATAITLFSSMGEWGWARHTSCTPSATKSTSVFPASASSISPPSSSPTR